MGGELSALAMEGEEEDLGMCSATYQEVSDTNSGGRASGKESPFNHSGGV